ncbi:MAG: hypothetical protein L0Z62_18895 [Gemmataceae bacterium]|nr:hypothetical protein [Gemmataceae bacterium]
MPNLVVALAVALPLSVPLMALAYKVNHGNRPLPMERQEFWLRSLGSGVGLNVLWLCVAALGPVLVAGGFPPTYAYTGLALVFVPLGLWYLIWMFALEDLLQALGLYLLFCVLFAVALAPLFFLLGVYS